jgi:hypothetical protein
MGFEGLEHLLCENVELFQLVDGNYLCTGMIVVRRMASVEKMIDDVCFGGATPECD